MEAVRKSWTDERMDDLNGRVVELGRRVDNGFNRVDADLRALRAETSSAISLLREEMKSEISSLREETKFEISSLREEMAGRLDRIDSRIDGLHRAMLQLGGGAIATFVIGFAGLIATQL